jgi:hypothetical protein
MMIRIRAAMGGHDRYVPLGERLLAVLRAYWQRARPPGEYLFQGTKRGEPISRKAIWHMVRQVARRAGIHKRVSPHTLRHCFATKHGRSVTLAPDEFIRRFLLHVLPFGFVKIRHFGLFAPGRAAAVIRERARRLLGAQQATADPEDWKTLFYRLTGIDLARCPRCRRGIMVTVPLPVTHDRAPPTLVRP